MSFPLTAAAAQVENFEALNEGLWVTPEAVQNIENTLAENARLLNESVATTEGAIANTTAALEINTNLENQLNTANQTIVELNARIAELENSGAPITQTGRANDETGGAAVVPFHASDANPFNQIADKLIPAKKA